MNSVLGICYFIQWWEAKSIVDNTIKCPLLCFNKHDKITLVLAGKKSQLTKKLKIDNMLSAALDIEDMA